MAEPTMEAVPEVTSTTTTPRSTSILQALGLTPEQVLDTSNVASTLAGSTSNSDVLGIYAAQEAAAGVPQLREQYQAAQDIARREQLTIGGRRKKMGVLRGEKQQAAELANADLNLLYSSLSSAEATANKRAGILADEYQQKANLLLEYPGLDIDPSKDSLEDISEEIGKYTEKQKYIEVLQQYGKNTKGSRGVLKKRYNSLLKKMDKAEKAKLEKEERRADEKWELEKANIQSQIASRGDSASGGLTIDDVKTTQEVSAYAQQMAAEGTDWGEAAEVFAALGWSAPDKKKDLDRIMWQTYEGFVPDWLIEEEG